jgi:hypothetical protein
MIKQMTKMMAMLVLAIGLTAGAATAQDKNGGFAPIGIYTGIEIDEGRCENFPGMCYGNAFALSSFGEWETHHLTISINYLAGGINPAEGFPVMSGSWTLVIYRNNAYAGTLNGEVLGGTVLIDQESSLKHVRVNLRSASGSGMFAGKDGEDISGIYQATTNLRSKETTGSANFGF